MQCCAQLPGLQGEDQVALRSFGVRFVWGLGTHVLSFFLPFKSFVFILIIRALSAIIGSFNELLQLYLGGGSGLCC